ncbi:hypothetical protein [Pseudoduganella sp. R-34]|uniref:hypothetical protein n=1 Tax=Pseudoduganella sp. R-34 TaxID=3404062 RepID=UPI003CEC3597
MAMKNRGAKHVTNVIANFEMSPRSQLGFFVMGVLFIALLFLDDFRASSNPLQLLGTAVFALLCLFAGVPGTLLPRRLWDYGIEMSENGFVYYEPLMTVRFVRYTDIELIVAETRSDGDDDTITQLIVHALDTVARLDEGIIFGTDVLEELKALPGFNEEAWLNALSAEGCPKFGLLAKQTVLLDVTKDE